MTTNIFDANSSIMATDSRWSIEYGSWIFYLDDTGYEKIERYRGTSLMFAGHGPKIQEYKNWIRSNPQDFSSMPVVKGMAVCMVKDSTGQVTFKKNQDIEANNVFCAGSGARPAYSCWLDNKCPRQAVETAKSKDNFSGGEVKYIDFKTNTTNVSTVYPVAQMDIHEVGKNISQRGNVMKIHLAPVGTPNLPFPKVSANASTHDEEAPRELVATLVSEGKLSATAPCDGMHNDWSEEEVNEFKGALADMFGWSN